MPKLWNQQSRNHKNSSLTDIIDEEKQQILTITKLEPANAWNMGLKND